MKIKNILLLAVLTWGNSLKMAATPVTAETIYQNVSQHTNRANYVFIKETIITFLQEVVCSNQVAVKNAIAEEEQGYIFARNRDDNQPADNELLKVNLTELLFDKGTSNAKKDLKTFLPKIETILKIQLVKECLADILKMDLSKIQDGTGNNFTALTEMQTGYKSANITLFLKGLKDLTFFQDDSVMKFVKPDGTLEGTPGKDSLLDKLFGKKTIFGVPDLTPEIFLQVIKLDGTDVGKTENVGAIDVLGQTLGLTAGGGNAQDVAKVATKILEAAQAYVTTSKITHFNGTGYGQDSNCSETTFNQTQYDDESQKIYVLESEYQSEIDQLKKQQDPSSQGPSQSSSTNQISNIKNEDIIATLKNEQIAQGLMTAVKTKLDELNKKTTKTSEEEEQIKGLQVLETKANNSTTGTNSYEYFDVLLNFIIN
jgi:hypothetical protein